MLKLIPLIVAIAIISGCDAFIGPSRFLKAPSRTTLSMTVDAPKQYELKVDNGAKAVVRTYGCNALSWVTKDGIEVLGTRADAVGDDSKPYAGGAPHCFPQFGPGALMQHGFARGMMFVPDKSSTDSVSFKLLPTDETKKVWDHNFEYHVAITLLADALEWDLSVINHGDKPFDITTGLHTYYDVSSLSNVAIQGPFTGAATIDKVAGTDGKAESDEVKVTKPIDMVFKGVTGPVSITDTGKGTKTTIYSKGYPDTVLWSPFGNDAMGFDKFVCVEPVAIDPVAVPPGSDNAVKYYMKVTCEKI